MKIGDRIKFKTIGGWDNSGIIKDMDDESCLVEVDMLGSKDVQMPIPYYVRLLLADIQGYDFGPVVPKKVIYNYPATIVIWKDGTKTVVKCNEDDWYNAELGVALCYVKKLCGNDSKTFHRLLKYWESVTSYQNP